MRLTLLTPTESWARTAKGYSKPDRDSLVYDYQLGSIFRFKEIHFDDLERLRDILIAEKHAILIYGVPNDFAHALGECPRQNKYFDYPDQQRTHVFDLDKWPVPSAVRDLIKPNLLDSKSMGELVNTLLRNEGFDIIADADKLVVLTSSSWDTEMLNCHVRVIFDKPVRVESLREFSLAQAQIKQRKIFDDAVYKAVQPQFFNPPICLDFEDPYADKRIFFVKGATRTVSLNAFAALVSTSLKLAEWNPHGTTSTLPPIGNDWLHTIQTYVGDERGINEPVYRAAAQLVQQVGRQHVIANINDYAQQMFDAVWKTLAVKNERGDNKDKQTYTLSKFRSYLDSATQKNFGNEVDQLVQQVNEAINAGIDGSLDKLMSTPVIHALKKLKSNYVSAFIPLKKALIEKHKLLKLTELNQLIKSAPESTVVDGLVVSDGGDWNENQLIDPVLQQYDYVMDHHGNRFASVPGNGDGGYRMLRIDGSLVDTFFSDGLKISGNKVTGSFGRKALSKLIGEESKESVSSFSQVLIGTRVVSEDQTAASPTWINLGRQPDGLFKSAKIEADKVTLVSHQDSKPKWFWGVPPLILPPPEKLKEKFNGFESMTDYLMSTLPCFISVDDDELIKIIMWICSTMADKSLAYLLELLGTPGSGKSTAADFIKDLVDPSGKGIGSGADRTAFWGVTSDFISDIERRHVTILDNISKLSAKEQDMLCMVSTGLRHSERILYTQSQMERVVRRPIIVTALNTIITRPDLRSRVVTAEMNNFTPFNPRLFEQWYEQRSYLAACFLRLTARTLKLYRDIKNKPSDIHPRDVFLSCVNGALTGQDEANFDYVRNFRLREAWDASYDSGFISVLTRYLDQTAQNNVVSINTRSLHQNLRKWCSLNAGKEIDGYTVDMLAVPETGRGLGWELAKNLPIIEKVSGWKIVKQEKLTNGKRYTFKKSVDRLDDLL